VRPGIRARNEGGNDDEIQLQIAAAVIASFTLGVGAVSVLANRFCLIVGRKMGWMRL